MGEWFCFSNHTGLRQSKQYCIIYGKKISTLSTNDVNFPSSAGTSTIPKMMGKNCIIPFGNFRQTFCFGGSLKQLPEKKPVTCLVITSYLIFLVTFSTSRVHFLWWIYDDCIQRVVFEFLHRIAIKIFAYKIKYDHNISLPIFQPYLDKDDINLKCAY